MRACSLLAYFDRVMAQGGDPNAKQLLADGKKYGQQGLDNCPSSPNPTALRTRTFKKMNDQMNGIFHCGHRNLDVCRTRITPAPLPHLRAAVDANSSRISAVVYPLALAYLGQTPPDYQNGIWFAARAAAVAPAAGSGAD